MVGSGIHRVDERHARPADVCGARPASTAWRARLLRSARAGSQTPTGGAGPQVRHPRVLLLLLLVLGPAAARTPARPHARGSRIGFPLLHLLGERKLVAPLGRLRAGHPDGAEAPARRSGAVHRGSGAGAARSALHAGQRRPDPARLSPGHHSRPSRVSFAPGARRPRTSGSGPSTSAPCRASATRRASRTDSTRWWSFLRTASASAR